MSEQSEILYEDGEVVWVKIGPVWWPSLNVGFDKLPPDILPSLRRKPFATVKFFQEDSYEYVKNKNFISKYNCSRKNEFIKKGLQDFRRGASHMAKFPDDVSMAETLTGGDPEIIHSEIFEVETKSPVTSSSSPTKKMNKRGADSHFSQNNERVSTSKNTYNTSKNDFKSEYTARILVQPSPTLNSSCERISQSSTLQSEDHNMEATPNQTSPRNSPQTYKCYACTFSTNRLNVMILHNKSHSGHFTPYTPSPIRPNQKPPIKSKASKNNENLSKLDITPQTKEKRGRMRKVQVDADKRIIDSKFSSEVMSTPKRGYAKVKDKESRKQKSNVEIKNSLLADWSGDSDESMDILTSLHLTEAPNDGNKVIATKYENLEGTSLKTAEKKEIEKCFSLVEKSVNLEDTAKSDGLNNSSSMNQADSGYSTQVTYKDEISISAEDDKKSKLSSCFDFREEEEWPLEADIGRKIPRVHLKIDSETRKHSARESLNDSIDESLKNKRDSRISSKSDPSKDFDLDAEIKTLLEATVVPELPSIPQTILHQENFPEAKAIKFPDKKDANAERPTTKTIFKTKSFFRSRHSRSQDAIEKYIADNTNINLDKSSYTERVKENDSSAELNLIKHENTADVVTALDLFESDPIKLTQSPQKVKVTKLAPKIELKKMKAAAQLQQTTNSQELNTSEPKVTTKSPQSVQIVSPQIDILGTMEPLELTVPVKTSMNVTDFHKKTEVSIEKTPTLNLPGLPEKSEESIEQALTSNLHDLLEKKTDVPGDKSLALNPQSLPERRVSAEQATSLKIHGSPDNFEVSIEQSPILHGLPGNSKLSPEKIPALHCLPEKVSVEQSSTLNLTHLPKKSPLSVDIPPSVNLHGLHEKSPVINQSGFSENSDFPDDKSLDLNLHSVSELVVPVEKSISLNILGLSEKSEVSIDKSPTLNLHSPPEMSVVSVTKSPALNLHSMPENSVISVVKPPAVNQHSLPKKSEIIVEQPPTLNLISSSEKSPAFNLQKSDISVENSSDLNFLKEGLKGTALPKIDPIDSSETTKSKHAVYDISKDISVIHDTNKETSLPNLGDLIRDEWNDDDIKISNVNNKTKDDLTVAVNINNETVPKAEYFDDPSHNINKTGMGSTFSSAVRSDEDITRIVCSESARIKEKLPSESDLQIAETLINLPGSSHQETLQEAEEDKNLNAAESLVQMSEILQNNQTSNAEIDVSKIEVVNQTEPQIAKSEKCPSIESQMAVLTDSPSDVVSPSKLNSGFETTSSKLIKMLEEPSPSKVKTNLQLLTCRPIQQKGKEKILNFGVSCMSPSKLPTGQPSKQKIIIRRAGTPLKSDIFADEGLPIVKNLKQSKDEMQTFTIQQSQDSDHSNITLKPKGNKMQSKPQKMYTKNTIITSTGAIVQPQKKSSDETLFDINSMPIVLSDDIVTPENIDSMPIVKSDGTVVPQLQTISKINTTKKPAEEKDIRPEIPKPALKSNVLIKQVVEKTSSPNILSKSSKLRNIKPLLVLDKSTGEQKFIMSKPDSGEQKIIMSKPDTVNEHKQMILTKQALNIVSQQSSTGKVEKFIILPSNPNSKPNMNKRHQKIILNPQTGKAHMIIGKPEDIPEVSNNQLKVPSKIVASLPSSDPTTNTVMIFTNAQGIQSRIVITPEHEKLLFPKKSMQSATVTSQTIVTSKGTLITPTHAVKGRTSLVTSQSIITSKGQILTTAPMNAVITSKGHLINQPTKVVSRQKGTIMSTEPQRTMTTIGKRAILTTVPGQAILTSKGQLLGTTQSMSNTSQGEVISSNKLPLNSPQQLKFIKKSQKPTEKVTSTVFPQTLKDRLSTPIQPSQLKLQKFMPTSATAGQPSKEPMIFLQQKSGNVVRLTAAEFQHLQITGQLVQKMPAPPPTSVKAPSAKASITKAVTSKVVMPKVVTPKASTKVQSPRAKSNANRIENAIPYKAATRKSGIGAVKHKLQSLPPPALSELIQQESEVVPLKKQRLRELLTKSESSIVPQNTLPIVSETLPVVSTDDANLAFDNLDDLIPSTTIKTHNILTDSSKAQPVLAKEPDSATVSITDNGTLSLIQTPTSVDTTNQLELQSNLSAPIEQQQTTSNVGDGQLLAVPGENFGGPPDTFYLCMEENGVLTPVDNQALVLQNNQLVPLVTQTQPMIEQPTLSLKESQIESVDDGQVPIQQTLTLPSDAGQQNILINAGDQQILLDQQTLMSLLAGDGQQLVTVDGQQLVLQGNVQQILAALAGATDAGTVLAPGQILDSTQQLLIPGTQSQLLLPESSEAFYETATQHHSTNQDILAAALANTDVFQQDNLIPDALNITTSTAEILMEVDSLSPNFHNLNSNLSTHSNVSETSSILNQPIMSPLELPTKKKDSPTIAMRSVQNANNMLAQNLEESLAVIGVTTPNIPASLELPITITNPLIAPKTTNPLSLTNVVYQRPIIPSPMILPTSRIADTPIALDAAIESSESLQEQTVSMPSLDNSDSFLSNKTAKITGQEVFPKMSMPLLTDDDLIDNASHSQQFSHAKQEKIIPKSMPLLTDLDDEPTEIHNIADEQHLKGGIADVIQYSSDLNISVDDVRTKVSPEAPVIKTDFPECVPHQENVSSLNDVSLYPQNAEVPAADQELILTESTIDPEEIAAPASVGKSSEFSISNPIDSTESKQIRVELAMQDEPVEELPNPTELSDHLSEEGNALWNTRGDTDQVSIVNTSETLEIVHRPLQILSPAVNLDNSGACIINGDDVLNLHSNYVDDSVNGEPTETLQSYESILASASPESNALNDDRSQIVETNSIPDRMSDELNIETSSTSTHNEFANPEMLTPDTIPPTPPEPTGENSHNLSETSSDSSEVIPLQPIISISHRTVQNFSNANSSPHSLSNEASSDKRPPSECDSSNGETMSTCKKMKYDEEER